MTTVVRYEPKGVSKPAIYTFLGLATLPRFRGRARRARDGPRTRGARRVSNPLRLLPREIVTHIARFAYRAGYRAHWVSYGNEDEAAVAIDVTGGAGGSFGQSATSLPSMYSGKTYYLEVSLAYAWWGTGLELMSSGALPKRFRFLLNNTGAGDDHREGNVACFWPGPDHAMLSMSSLGVDSWSYVDAPVTMSVLVDMVRGCATFGLNGVAGPCMRFTGDEWRGGVHIIARGFPTGDGIHPVSGTRCIVACATPPTPPSMMAAASHPMTVSEHLAAGSLRTEANTPVDGGNWGGVM